MKTAEDWEQEAPCSEGKKTIKFIKSIQLNALQEAARVCSVKAGEIYVGANPIREGIKRGMRQSAVAILSLANNLTNVDNKFSNSEKAAIARSLDNATLTNGGEGK